MFQRFIVTLIITTGLRASAEYRAYQLEIANAETGQSRIVLSTLDHLQYATYYPLRKNEIIQYVDSWMCFENMGNYKKICPKPEESTQTLSTSP